MDLHDSPQISTVRLTGWCRNVRFRELRLVAYGPFTDQVVDFGQRPECDLHVVLGLNEAGKTSALRAINALLFGFPHTTPDAHLHPYDRLRVGALLEAPDGQSVEFARVKARQRDLRDAKDEPLDDGVLRNMLTGIEEALYQRLFLVNQAELREGGASLVAGGGDFGVSLFGATLGGGSLVTVRRELRQRSEALFKPDAKARKPILNAALLAYRHHLDQARSLSVKSRDYKAATARVDELADQRAVTARELANLERDERALRRLASVTGPLARRKVVLEALDDLTSVPELEEGAKERRETVVEKHAEATGRIESEQKRLKDLGDEVKRLVVNDELLARGAEIKTLAGQLATHEKALGDRANRVGEREARQREVDDLRGRLDSAAPEQASPIDRETLAQIGDLGDEHAKLAERRRAAVETIRGLDEEQRKAASALAQALAPPKPPEALERWAKAAGERVASQLAAEQQKRAVERDIKKLLAQTGALSPPFDPAAPPSGEPPAKALIAEHQQAVGELDAKQADLLRERDRLASHVDGLRTQLAAVGAEEVAHTREQMVDARSERNQSFDELGSRLRDDDLPAARDAHAALGELLPRADELADTLLSQAEKVARRDQLEAEIGELQHQRDERDQEIIEVKSQREQLRDAWQELWRPCGIEALDDVAAMLAWRERYEQVTLQHAELVAQLSEHDEVLRAADEVADHLRAALKEIGASVEPDLPLEQLVEHARGRADRINTAVQEHAQLVTDADEAEADLGEAQGNLKRVEEELEDWNVRWTRALEPFAIAADTAPANARATLGLISELAAAEKDVANLQHRIGRIDADYGEYGETVSVLVTELASELTGKDALEAIRALEERHEAAKTAASERDRLREREDALKERIADLEADVRTAEGALQRMCETAGCDTAEQLPEIERRAGERDKLRHERGELEKRIVEQGERPLVEIELELGARSGDEIAAELATHEDTLKAAKSELEGLVEEHTKAVTALSELDHGIEAALERELAERDGARAGELAERYLAERAGAILLARAIEHHREHSATPILERTQQLLPQLTASSLTRLFVEDDGGEHPVLMARRADGRELGVDGMSDGALDQLYLALRLAALEHHLGARPPLPLLLDDILVNYDEPRTGAALPALAEVAQRTQVIVLTHHRHVAEIATDTLGERVCVHHLGESTV